MEAVFAFNAFTKESGKLTGCDLLYGFRLVLWHIWWFYGHEMTCEVSVVRAAATDPLEKKNDGRSLKESHDN